MWCALLAVILLNLSTGFASPGTPEIRTPEKELPSALLRYPEAALVYFLKTRSNPDRKKCLAEFKKLLPVIREKICVKYLVGAESFSLPSIGRSNYVVDDFKSLVCDTYKSVSDTFIESFDFNGSDGLPYNTSAQLCVSTNVDGNKMSWVISPSYHEGVMFLFVQSQVSNHHRLNALLEEMPDIQRDDWDQQQVEMLYASNRIERLKMTELNSKEESAVASRSLCEMDRFEWFRTCSVGYLAWKHSKYYQPTKGEDGINTKGNYVNVDFPEDFPKCIKSNVELSIKIPNKIRAIDVIPCAINKGVGQADFFLTSDPFSPTSMFTVVPIWKDDVHSSHRLLGSEDDTLFKLELYMTNVRVLKFFNNLP